MSLCFRALPDDTNVKPELQSTVAPAGWFPGPLPTSKEGWVGWGGGIPDGLLKNTLHFPCVDWLQCSENSEAHRSASHDDGNGECCKYDRAFTSVSVDSSLGSAGLLWAFARSVSYIGDNIQAST